MSVWVLKTSAKIFQTPHIVCTIWFMSSRTETKAAKATFGFSSATEREREERLEINQQERSERREKEGDPLVAQSCRIYITQCQTFPARLLLLASAKTEVKRIDDGCDRVGLLSLSFLPTYSISFLTKSCYSFYSLLIYLPEGLSGLK